MLLRGNQQKITNPSFSDGSAPTVEVQGSWFVVAQCVAVLLSFARPAINLVSFYKPTAFYLGNYVAS